MNCGPARRHARSPQSSEIKFTTKSTKFTKKSARLGVLGGST
jgi:hypothetical protein